MLQKFYSHIIDFTGIIIIGLVIYFISFGKNIVGDGESFLKLPASFLNLNTIFLSILVEAIPFVLIGVLIAGIIQIFITEEHIKRWIPKNKYLAVVMSCVVGSLFPACECGIVPIVRRLIAKGVPLHAGIGFMLTGPLINPIVILSTFMAFGNDFKIAGLRMGIGFLAAVIIALIVSFMFKTNQLKHSLNVQVPKTTLSNQSLLDKLFGVAKHSIDEFFDMGKYLIIGAFFAASVQTYVSTGSLLEIGSGIASSTLVMMGLAYVLSLCSEADAFIAASFKTVFPTTSILAFLIYGPMIDLKNTFMMFSVFKSKFVMILVPLITLVVFIVMMIAHSFI